MDITVSGLNGRLASKLPPELPLGLVFVVGTVETLNPNGFVLAEADHRLSCRVDAPIEIAQGDEVRASGHLMFDSRRLQYYLLTRDIEIVTSEPLDELAGDSRELLAEDDGLLSALAAVKARATVSPGEAEGAELPVWVRKLAPPEIGSTEPALPESQKAALDAELVALLSEAMDSEEEMEVTPELLAPYTPAPAPEADVELAASGMGEETAVSLAALSTSYQPSTRQDTDWLVVLLIISFFVLAIAAIVTIILLLVP